MKRSGRITVLLASAWALGTGALACTRDATSAAGPAPAADAGPGPSPDPAADAGDDPCAVDRTAQYQAFLTRGTCADVPAESGRWIVASLFPDAPPAIRDVACTWRWSSPTRAPADVASLRASPVEALTKSAQPWPTCISGSAPASARRFAPPTYDESGAPPTGVSGCDVCARAWDKSVYAILPADRLTRLRYVVLTDAAGEHAWFEMMPAADRNQAFRVDVGPGFQDGKVPLFDEPF